MADTKEQEPKVGGAADPGATPRGEEPKVAPDPAAPPKNPKGLEAAVAELAAITGQHPVVTRAKKSIANFNLREGMAVGCAVTLRGARMYEFLDRFISIAVPR